MEINKKMNQEYFKKQIPIACKACLQRTNQICYAVVISLILITVVFLYANCLKTAYRAKIVSILKKQVAINVVDMDTWKKVNAQIKWKKQPLQGEGLKRNPFD